MVSVLFVCLGNICRSPMAEAIFRDKVKRANLSDVIRIDSAGTAGWHEGKPPHEGTRSVLDARGIDWKGQRARQVTAEDFAKHQWIIAMDASNAADLARMYKGATIRLMLDYHPEKRGADVPDPYYTGNFEEVYELLDTACEQLLSEIRQTNNF
ncbi:low molecular weight protein-tyrosine-phosphatase [Paenibacillus thermoaerophilus]|uniref:protein-tyrosine-phosphatase n=1 Tax=Paenibacillus thermoaerophilus TaxID=1215385 RepID=A0ABW2V7Z3_9BACL|nr:low molecular weight protein-tyrosine-phosphatase [Paenibacillus thermoaerophilus]TMV17173.1 low molecular weight phosphotyrosine protein phosphatase [Paenibacillus thermoaerophilus]